MGRRADFRGRLRARDPLVGTFIRTPAAAIVEIVADSGLDFAILDAEHAPFGAQMLDQCLMAGLLKDLPLLVRVPALDGAAIGAMLDMGAIGIVVPHIRSADDARRAVEAALYHGGSRGISGSHRAAGYGRADLAAWADEADAATVIIGQLEDACARDEIEAIAAVERVDGLFVGRADLMLSLGARDPQGAAVNDAVATFAAAARRAGRSLGTFVAPDQVAAGFRDGYNFLAAGTEQAILKRALETIARTAK